MPEPRFQTTLLERRNGRVVAGLGMALPHPVVEVWAAITDPARMVEWLAPGDIEPRPGGTVKLHFPDSGIVIDSRITAFDAMRVLEYSWSRPGEPERPIRFQLDAIEAGTFLRVTLDAPGDEDAGRTAAGWAAHLEMLAAALRGAPIRFPFEVFKAAREDYRARLAADQAS